MSGALWCIVGRRLQLPCRCAAWLTQRLAGSQSQRREAVPLQFSVSERTGEGRGDGGRRHRDVRKKGGERGGHGRERGMRGGDGKHGRRKGEAGSATSIPADPNI